MELEFRIPDLEVEITIRGGSSRFFDMLLLMGCILHFLRMKEWLMRAFVETSVF